MIVGEKYDVKMRPCLFIDESIQGVLDKYTRMTSGNFDEVTFGYELNEIAGVICCHSGIGDIVFVVKKYTLDSFYKIDILFCQLEYKKKDTKYNFYPIIGVSFNDITRILQLFEYVMNSEGIRSLKIEFDELNINLPWLKSIKVTGNESILKLKLEPSHNIYDKIKEFDISFTNKSITAFTDDLRKIAIHSVIDDLEGWTEVEDIFKESFGDYHEQDKK